MVNSGDRHAILRGMRAAMRLHRDLGTKDNQDPTVRVDVYGAIARSGAVLMFKPLDSLLGAFLREGNTRGVVVTLRRPVGVQRFTASHELGHLVMEHEPNADGEDILRRAPIGSPSNTVPIQEREADSFASYFLLPKFALAKLDSQQEWTKEDYKNPHTVYQAALRLGASYHATIMAYERDGIINRRQRESLLKTQPRELKEDLVADHTPENWQNRDVWRLTERDAGTVIEAGRDDLFLIKLKEHRGGGYVWTFDQLKKAGFVVLKDDVEAMFPGRIGGVQRRWVLGDTSSLTEGDYTLEERREWGDEDATATLTLRYKRTPGRTDGLFQDQLDRLIESE